MRRLEPAALRRITTTLVVERGRACTRGACRGACELALGVASFERGKLGRMAEHAGGVGRVCRIRLDLALLGGDQAEVGLARGPERFARGVIEHRTAIAVAMPAVVGHPAERAEITDAPRAIAHDEDAEHLVLGERLHVHTSLELGDRAHRERMRRHANGLGTIAGTSAGAMRYDKGLETAACTTYPQVGRDVAYSITLTGGTAYTFAASVVSPDFDPSIALFGPGATACSTGPTVASTCVKGADVGAAGEGETFAYTPTATGVYYVVDSFYARTGSYTLKVTSP